MIKKLRKNQEGSVAVLIGLMLPVLVGFLGLALDLGNLVVVRTQMQNAVDAAACGGALQLQSSQALATSEANALIINNNFNLTPTVTFTQDTVKNPSNHPEINVTLTNNVPTFFMKVLGISTVNLNAYAEAILIGGSTGPFAYAVFSNTNLTIGPAAFNITGSIFANEELIVNGAENISGRATGVTEVSLSGAGNLGSVSSASESNIHDSGAFNIGSESGGAQTINLSNYNYTQQIQQTAATTINGNYTQSGALNISGNVYATGTATLNGAINNTGAILANGNITVTGAANISGSGQVFLYSANGNITLNGAMNFGTGSSSAILYAPNGTISISGAYNFNGGIIANAITFPSAAFNVNGGYPITSLNLGSHAEVID
jgi:Flp pilus assembly protein TadG